MTDKPSTTMAASARDITADEATEAAPVSAEQVEAFRAWLQQGRRFGLIDVRLGSGASVWFEEDQIVWEPC